VAEAALVLAILLAAAHSYLGERYILIRLFRRADLPKLFGGTAFTTRTLRFAWHLTSLAWIGLATTLVLPGRVAEVVALTFGTSGLAALAGSRGRHLSWVVFLAIAALAGAAR
jgi:hypothetical protein